VPILGFIVEYMTSRRAIAVVELVIEAENLADAVAKARDGFAAIRSQLPGRPPRGIRIPVVNLDMVRPFRLE
jgi:hypothetical protein